MAQIEAIAPPDFLPLLAGAIAVPLAAGVVPGINRLGPLAPLALGAGAAALGKGNIRKAGQGAVLVSAVSFIGPMLAGVLGGGQQATAAGRF